MSFETQANQTFWRDIPGFCWDIPEMPDKFEKKFVFNFWPLLDPKRKIMLIKLCFQPDMATEQRIV